MGIKDNPYLQHDLSPSPTPPRKIFKLDLFPGLPDLLLDNHSTDFDYQAAIESDVLDATLHRIVYGSDVVSLGSKTRHLYPVNGDDEVLASDPYTP